MAVRSFTGSGQRFRGAGSGWLKRWDTIYQARYARQPMQLRTVARVTVVSIRSRPFVRSPIATVTTAVPLMTTRLNGREPDRRGKVRDLFDAGSSLLIVATDRISAFDYVLGSGIPDKGKVLTQLSAFWFARTAGIVPNHLLSTDPADVPARRLPRTPTCWQGRVMLVRKTTPFPIECVARGYLSGSGWKDYQQTGSRVRRAAAGWPARVRPAARSRSSRRPPRPASGHDINITEAEAAELVGPDTLAELRRLTLALYEAGAAARGVPRDPAGRHEVRVRHDRNGSHPAHRRGDDAGFVALLAGRHLPARRAHSPASTSSSCATTWKRFAGTSSRRCRRCPTRWWPRRGTSTWRRTNA